MEVVPIIAGLLLDPCLNGLNKKIKKDNAQLTKFVKSPSSISRLWKRSPSDQQKPLKSASHKHQNNYKPYRIHHEHFYYFIDPVQLRILAKDVDNFIDVDMTTSDI
ncbi:unnamed protein product [Ambrosiozyma monospora]|uniref:Unnamed protein product n=1 Tax=Ambrosiozyma monospora TaxID=43982 RepID=A0ACB5UD19_AMBMO|nr:unnamed protein product [Ambrosiozyma monospora]